MVQPYLPFIHMPVSQVCGGLHSILSSLANIWLVQYYGTGAWKFFIFYFYFYFCFFKRRYLLALL